MEALTTENVQHYPRPPALEPVPQRLRVILGGITVTETQAALRVLETHHAPTYYLPRSDIRPGVLKPVSGASYCEWKGRAAYFDVVAGGVTAARAAWSYPKPSGAFSALAGHVAFYSGRMQECWVGDVRVTPQPGDFYGGWVTPNLTGIVKGGPGTLGW